MYESHNQAPISRARFLLRLAGHVGIVALLVLVSLAVGIGGYMALEGLALEDAFLHAATLLGGLGLAAPPASTGGKLFAGLYALYAGLVFLAAFGVIAAPIAHRLLHSFHWEGDRAERP